MAWSFSGNWEGIHVQDLSYVMRDLCWAVNEREKFCGRGDTYDTWSPWYTAWQDAVTEGYTGSRPTCEPLTEWTMLDGSTTKTFPEWADFDGWPLVGTASEVVGLIGELRTAIEALLPGSGGDKAHNRLEFMGGPSTLPALNTSFDSWFVSAPESSSYPSTAEGSWTLSTLLGAGTFGSSWLTIDDVADSRVWEQMREALDNLIYVRYNMYAHGSPYYIASGGDAYPFYYYETVDYRRAFQNPTLFDTTPYTNTQWQDVIQVRASWQDATNKHTWHARHGGYGGNDIHVAHWDPGASPYNIVGQPLKVLAWAKDENVSSLQSAMNSTETTVDISAFAVHPRQPGYYILVDSEEMKVTATNFGELTVLRGQNGTTAAAHSSGASVSLTHTCVEARLATDASASATSTNAELRTYMSKRYRDAREYVFIEQDDTGSVSLSGMDYQALSGGRDARCQNTYAGPGLSIIFQGRKDDSSESTDISVEYVNPGSYYANTTCSVSGDDITFTLEHGTYHVEATNEQILTAYNGNSAAKDLVDVHLTSGYAPRAFYPDNMDQIKSYPCNNGGGFKSDTLDEVKWKHHSSTPTVADVQPRVETQLTPTSYCWGAWEDVWAYLSGDGSASITWELWINDRAEVYADMGSGTFTVDNTDILAIEADTNVTLEIGELESATNTTDYYAKYRYNKPFVGYANLTGALTYG